MAQIRGFKSSGRVVDSRPRLARLFAEACQRGVWPLPVGSHRYFLLLDQFEPARLVTYALRAEGQLCAATRCNSLSPSLRLRTSCVIEAEDFLRHYPDEWLGAAAGQLVSHHDGHCVSVVDKVRADLVAARRAAAWRRSVAPDWGSGVAGSSPVSPTVSAAGAGSACRVPATVLGMVPPHSTIQRVAGEHSLAFYCGDLPADPVVVAHGYEPNGHFWESVSADLEPALVSRLELDSEGSMFSAVGDRRLLQQLQQRLEPIIASADAAGDYLRRAAQRGVVFED